MEVIINGTKAELGNSLPAITKKSVDINDPSTRFIDFTNSFVLPDTDINRRIFKGAKVIGANSRSLDAFYDVSIVDVFKIFKGKGFLNGYDKNGYKFQVVDDSKALFNALDIKLKSISWDDKDTILTTAAIDALDVADPNNCWFWGKACYHAAGFIANTDQTTGNNRCKYSRPAFYVSALLKRAIEGAGYSFSLPAIELAMSSNHKQFFFTSYQKTFNTTFNPAGTYTITGLNTYDFKHADVTATSTEITMLHKTVLRFRGHVETSADIYLNVHAHDGPHTKEIVSKILLPRSGEIDFSTSEIWDTPAGMIAYVQLIGTGTVKFTNVLMYTLLDEKNEDLSTNHWLDFKIKAYDNLPDITYLDLFKLICLTGNQYQKVNLKKEFSFDSLSNLSKLNSVDWSDKFVIDSEGVSPLFDGLFKSNILKYTNDITVNTDLGQYAFAVDNDSLTDEGVYIELPFGASKEVNIAGNNIAHVPIYDNTTRIPDQEINIRLFGIDGSRLVFDAISWENLYNNYYANFFRSLRRVRLINCDMNLSKLDVLSWHEKQLVYIDYFKSTFIVLEINNFIPGKLTKVKLLNYGR